MEAMRGSVPKSIRRMPRNSSFSRCNVTRNRSGDMPTVTRSTTGSADTQPSSNCQFTVQPFVLPCGNAQRVSNRNWFSKPT